MNGFYRIVLAAPSHLARLLLWILVVATPARLLATDFLRGDVNADGRVTPADFTFLQNYQFKGGQMPTCLDAGDTDDNGALQLTDSIKTFRFFIYGLDVPPAPSSSPGPDPTEDEVLCETYQITPPVQQPGVALGIFGASASPATGGYAVITISISNPELFAGYSGKVLDPEGVLADSFFSTSLVAKPPYEASAIIATELVAPTGDRGRAFIVEASVRTGKLSFGVLAAGSDPDYYFPLEDVPVLELKVPLKPGIAPGEYPLTFELAEIVTLSGFSTAPPLVNATLRVRSSEDFVRGDCNGDGSVAGTVSDAVYLLAYNFAGGAAPLCLAACDANGDGEVTGVVTDAIYLLSFNFLGGLPPAPPFPGCGEGNAADAALSCDGKSAACP